MSMVSLDRRRLIGGCLCGAGAMLAPASGRAAARRARPGAIDIHYHVTTPVMRAIAERGGNPIPFPPTEISKAIAQMDEGGVQLSVISMPIVSTQAPKDLAEHKAFARRANEDAATVVRQNPGRFRFFAYLPVPHMDAALEELAYAIDTLGAVGVYLCTSYGDRWLGDPSLAPLMDELDRRGTVVFTHPMGAACCQAVQKEVGPPIIEYGTDTARAIASLIFSGAAAKHPKIRFIFSHAGGVAPFLFERFDRESARRKAPPEQSASALLKRFFYDTAQAANPYALGDLARLVPPSQILFGSDYEWRSAGEQLASLDKLGFAPATLSAIRRENAIRLIPSLATGPA